MGATRAGSPRQLTAIARRQHGVFTRRQATACGYTSAFIRRRVLDHAWQELDPCVYRVTLGSPPTIEQRLMALVLATGGVAALRSAAALYDLLSAPDGPQVLVERAKRTASHRRSGVSSIASLDPIDVCVVRGIPTTRPALTLISLANGLPEPEIHDLVDTAIVRRLVSARQLAERATALWAPRRRGCAVVLRILRDQHPQLRRARNRWEARVVRILRNAGAPDGIPNHEVFVGGRKRIIDLAWPDQRVAVEFDGFVPHSKRGVFDDDRSRQNDLVDDEWRVFRLTSTAVRRAPDGAIAPILRALGVDR